jgi:FAD/FMN-containing dehydrogenase
LRGRLDGRPRRGYGRVGDLDRDAPCSTEGAERVRAAYAPATYERLVALKDAYDSDNVFHLNQNVAPST